MDKTNCDKKQTNNNWPKELGRACEVQRCSRRATLLMLRSDCCRVAKARGGSWVSDGRPGSSEQRSVRSSKALTYLKCSSVVFLANIKIHLLRIRMKKGFEKYCSQFALQISFSSMSYEQLFSGLERRRKCWHNSPNRRIFPLIRV